MSTVIRAELVGDDRCEAAGITVRADSPVLLLARKLVAAGFDPALALHAYRGNTLCLLVRSIGEAAALQVNTSGTGFSRYRVHGPSLRPPVEKTAGAATRAPSLAGASP